MGAEKALFRALKTKHATPKYGLLYHAQVVGQSAPKNKGKMSRVLAAKSVLMARFDAFAEEPNMEIGLECRAKVDMRLRQLEGEQIHTQTKSASKPKPAKAGAMATPQSYNASADSTLSAEKKKHKKEKKEKNGTSEPEQSKKRKAEDDVLVDSEDAPKKKKKKSKTSEV